MITTVQCSICSQLNNKLRVVVTDIRLHHTFSIIIINPRRACARVTVLVNPRRACARVTVLVLCVCLCVCVFSLFWHLAQSGVQKAVSATSARYGHEI